ncbi:MAG: hypothetical protein ACO29O_03525, partial [Chitinophagaceae bacterium]
EMCRNWYDSLSDNYLQRNAMAQQRKAELYAMKGDYKSASEGLSKVKGFEEKAASYNDQHSFLRDSIDWKIGYLQLNSQYRDFSPFIIGDKLFWSTNNPGGKKTKNIQGWDSQSFARINVTDDPEAKKNVPTPARDTAKGKKIRNVAFRSDLSDVPVLSKSILPINNGGGANYRAMQPKGLDTLKKNVAHISYAPAQDKIYLTVNEQVKVSKKLVNRLRIIEANYKDNIVSDLKMLSFGDSITSATHPAVHPSGDLLVFSSDNAGGKGGFDIYISKKDGNGNWSAAEPLDPVNTAGNDVFPQFGPDGKLYFSSDAMPGLGGLDLYRLTLNPAGIAGPVEYLSYPINSSYDDFGITFDAGGKEGFFSTNRLGNDDIFSFIFDEQFIMLTGVVVDKTSNQGIEGLQVDIFEKDEKTGALKPISNAMSSLDGGFNFKLKPNRSYITKVKSPVDSASAEVDPEFLKSGNKVVLSLLKELPPPPQTFLGLIDSLKSISKSWYQVHHFFDKREIVGPDWEIMKKARAELKADPTLRVVVLSATDCLGDEIYNDKLSKKRSNYIRVVTQKHVKNKIEMMFVGERYLELPCDPETAKPLEQLPNRYSYLFLIKD